MALVEVTMAFNDLFLLNLFAGTLALFFG